MLIKYISALWGRKDLLTSETSPLLGCKLLTEPSAKKESKRETQVELVQPDYKLQWIIIIRTMPARYRQNKR